MYRINEARKPHPPCNHGEIRICLPATPHSQRAAFMEAVKVAFASL